MARSILIVDDEPDIRDPLALFLGEQGYTTACAESGERALELLEQIKEHVRPGGRAIVNVLVEGTTFLEMFVPEHHCIFGREELRQRFVDWNEVAWRAESYPAPEETRKEFTTLVAQKPHPFSISPLM